MLLLLSQGIPGPRIRLPAIETVINWERFHIREYNAEIDRQLKQVRLHSNDRPVACLERLTPAKIERATRFVAQDYGV